MLLKSLTTIAVIKCKYDDEIIKAKKKQSMFMHERQTECKGKSNNTWKTIVYSAINI